MKVKNYYAEVVTIISKIVDKPEIVLPVLYEIAKAHPSVIVMAYDKINPGERVFYCRGQEECRKYVGKKIEAIKACRDATKKSLLSAKIAVEGECPAWK